MVRKKEFTPEAIAQAKHLYEQTLAPVNDIIDMLGVGKPRFYRLVKAEGWKGRRASAGTFQFARAVVDAAALPAAASGSASKALAEARVALAARIQNAAEREIEAIERLLAVMAPADNAEADRTARTLASVARALREIAALNQPEEVAPPDEADPDPVPSDIDEFREALARRIESFIAARRAANDGGVSGDANAGSVG